jgi:hypothetical protein
MSDMTDLEARIKKIKSQREQLVSQKAEKVARLKNAQEELRNLKEEAAEKGYDLKEIPDLLPQKRKELNGKVALAESALEEVEEKLAKYDD